MGKPSQGPEDQDRCPAYVLPAALVSNAVVALITMCPRLFVHLLLQTMSSYLSCLSRHWEKCLALEKHSLDGWINGQGVPWSKQQVPEQMFPPLWGGEGGSDLLRHCPILRGSNGTDGATSFFPGDIQELILEDTAVWQRGRKPCIWQLLIFWSLFFIGLF